MRTAIIFGSTAIAKAINMNFIADHAEMFKLVLFTAIVADIIVELRKNGYFKD